jgi:hypothetical protein
MSAPRVQPTTDLHYFANPVRGTKALMSLGRHLGFISTPKQGNRIPDGAFSIADNGMGPGKAGVIKGQAGKGAVTPEHLLAWLGKYSAGERDRCLLAVAPDVVGDAAATAERSRPMLSEIRALGYAVAYVLQDGQESVPVPWGEIDAVFIGGSDAFNLGPVAAQLVAEAKRRGLWVHMGRVNSRRRMIYAASIGCDSVDGTYLVFGARRCRPNVNLPRLLRWLAEINAKPITQSAFALTA